MPTYSKPKPNLLWVDKKVAHHKTTLCVMCELFFCSSLPSSYPMHLYFSHLRLKIAPSRLSHFPFAHPSLDSLPTGDTSRESGKTVTRGEREFEGTHVK